MAVSRDDAPGGASSREVGMSQFLLHTSHDMKTALRAIRMHSDLLLKDGEAVHAAGLEERLGFIVDGVRKIDLLADGITRYSIALEIQEGSFEPAPLNVLLRAALAKLDRDIRAHQATVTYDKLPCVRGDTDRLMEVFESLVRNALDHRGSDAPHIQINVEQRPPNWLFGIRDNGPGVSEPYLERIFEPFVHLRANKHLGPGLGLTICRIILERHGGRIWAESPAGGGGAFLFTLPLEQTVSPNGT